VVLRRVTPFRALLVGALVATCTPGAVQGPGDAPVRSVTVTPPASTIPPGSSRQFTATVRDSAGAVLTGRTVVWSSSNESVARVNGVGRVDAQSPGGPVTITATSEGKSGTASVTVAVPPPNDTYTTNFDVDENPLSEGGKWLHLDALLTRCKVVGGRAFGTQVIGSPIGPFDDSNVYLTGFGDNYEVEGTVWLNPGLTGPENREVEILLRWTDDGLLRSTLFGLTHANGYEITVQHAGQYMSLGRFKGDELVHLNRFGAVPKTGDRFRARIEGQRIRVWWNDVLKMDFTDTDPSLQVTTGNPGIGFFTRASNSDYGYEAVTVRRLP
jgi:hypothetical protein